MVDRVIITVLVAFILAATVLPAANDSEQRINEPPSQLGFALWLFQQQDYQRAVTECKRFIYSYPQSQISDRAVFLIAMCYAAEQDWGKAYRAYGDVVANYPSGHLTAEAHYRQGECLFNLVQFEQAEEHFRKLWQESPDSEFADDAHLMTAISLMMKPKWKKAKKTFDDFNALYPDSPLQEAAQQLSKSCKKGTRLRRKNPTIAGILSLLLPGAGQVYSGRHGDGLMAFLVNGGFAILAKDGFDSHRNTTGLTFSLIGTSFYLGNLYGARGAARRYNRATVEKHLNDSLRSVDAILKKSLGKSTRISDLFDVDSRNVVSNKPAGNLHTLLPQRVE